MRMQLPETPSRPAPAWLPHQAALEQLPRAASRSVNSSETPKYGSSLLAFELATVSVPQESEHEQPVRHAGN